MFIERTCLLLLFISMATAAVNVADICTVNKIVNGCSVPESIPVPYQNEFLPACNRHDICYECGIVYGIPRHICDMKFYDDMDLLCMTKKKSLFRKDICRVGAQMYYRTVEMFGGSRWNSKINDFCKMPWITMCLPPTFMTPIQRMIQSDRGSASTTPNQSYSGTFPLVPYSGK